MIISKTDQLSTIWVTVFWRTVLFDQCSPYARPF